MSRSHYIHDPVGRHADTLQPNIRVKIGEKENSTVPAGRGGAARRLGRKMPSTSLQRRLSTSARGARVARRHPGRGRVRRRRRKHRRRPPLHASPATRPPAPLPAWLAERLRPAPLPPQRPVEVSLPAGRAGGYLRAAVDSELARVLDSPPHGHNTALYRAAVALGQLVAGGALSEADVTAWLTDAAGQVGQRPGETARTIASGLRAGARRPRSVAA